MIWLTDVRPISESSDTCKFFENARCSGFDL